MKVAQDLKRTLVAFSIEMTCLVFSYFGYLLWRQGSITRSTLADTLVAVSFSMLFALDYAILSRRPQNEAATPEPSQAPSGTKREQALRYLKILGGLSSGQLASLLEVDVRNLSKFVNPLIQTGIIAARKEGKTFIYSLRDSRTNLNTHNHHTSSEEAEYAVNVELPKSDIRLPSEGNILGRVALDDWKLGDFVYLPLKRYAQKGILVSGASGSGKTVAAKVIVEELLAEHTQVVVFDYTKQWERLFQKNTDEKMTEGYRAFGMRASKAFKGRVVKQLPEISEILRANEGTVVDLSSVYETDERVGKVATALDQILEHFQGEEDSEDLRLFLVIEEAHLWTSKEVPKDASRFLDKVVRLLRKKGVGVMLVSHKISDFDPAMRSSMNISIAFRTKYEGDLDTIARTMGSEFSKIVPSMPIGYSLFHSSDLGSPFVMAWRPLYSQP